MLVNKKTEMKEVSLPKKEDLEEAKKWDVPPVGPHALPLHLGDNFWTKLRYYVQCSVFQTL